MGLASTGMSANMMNGNIINQDMIRASLGQPVLGHSLPNMMQVLSPQRSNVGPPAGPPAPPPIQSQNSQGIASHSQGISSEDQVVPAQAEESRGRQTRETGGETGARLPDLDHIVVDRPGIIDVIVILVVVAVPEFLPTLRVNWM